MYSGLAVFHLLAAASAPGLCLAMFVQVWLLRCAHCFAAS